jgi:inhibitor of cysteine peptidase
MKTTIIILLATIIVTGCTCTPNNQCNPTEASTMITPKVGEEFNITLDANPTTGYQWKLSDNFTEGVVKLVGSEYVAPETEMVGVGGKEVWTFEGVRSGETTVELEYVRPWETGVEPAVVKSFGVTVE